MSEHTARIVRLMREAFDGDDVRKKNVELSRGAHEIERLAEIVEREAPEVALLRTKIAALERGLKCIAEQDPAYPAWADNHVRAAGILQQVALIQ